MNKIQNQEYDKLISKTNKTKKDIKWTQTDIYTNN